MEGESSDCFVAMLGVNSILTMFEEDGGRWVWKMVETKCDDQVVMKNVYKIPTLIFLRGESCRGVECVIVKEVNLKKNRGIEIIDPPLKKHIACEKYCTVSLSNDMTIETRGFYMTGDGHCTEAIVRRCSVKNVYLEVSQNLQENICARASFLIKLQA